MSNSDQIASILKRLKDYKRKYYLNRLLKGVLISLAYLLIAFLTFSVLEYQLRFGSLFRSLLFIVYAISGLYFIIKYILIPAYHLATQGKALSNEEAARQIGKYFPEINDKLLNFIQLNTLSGQQNTLIQASIEQKSRGLSSFNFSEGIKIQKNNRKYFPYVAIPILVMITILLFAPYLVTEGSYRIIKFNEEFVPEAPFMFHVEPEVLKAYKGEPFKLNVELSGNQIPKELYIYKEGVKQKLQNVGNNAFQFTLNNPQQSLNFSLEGAGFSSQTYHLTVVERPTLQNMAIELVYPAYTGLERERIENAGNLIVPEGTQAKWWVQSKATSSIVFDNSLDSTEILFDNVSNTTFNLEQYILNSFSYKLKLLNPAAEDDKNTTYSVEVIKDKAPEITLEAINDSSMYSKVALAGEISDDYGFTNFKLFYTLLENNKEKLKGSIALPYNKEILNQKYFKLWDVDSLLQKQGDKLQYYVQVWDNDAINGAKSTRTALKTIQIPDKSQLETNIKENAQETEKQIDQNIKSASDVNKKLEKLDQILKTKRSLNWEDKQLLEEILKDMQQQEKRLEEIQRKTEENKEKREKFTQQNPELKEKSEQLESLMEEMLKDKNDELMEKIREMLQNESQSDEFRESVEELNKKENNRLKEMERLMELFKRLEVQYDMNKVGEDLKELSEKQEQLANETEKNNSEKSTEQNTEALEEQERLNKDFEEIKEELKNLKERNQSLKQPNAIEDTKEEENTIDQAQQESTQQLKEQNSKSAGQKQKEAAEGMKQMAQKMAQMQASMEMQALQENIDDLRDIVDNLLKLSFRQEDLMKNFREVNASDPRFLSLSEQQLNMKDDAVIIEDSLNALAERVFQLKTFITKEMATINESMDNSLSALKERDKNKAVGEQQFAMTSMNNLALMLDDVLEQMQMQMQASQGMSSQPQQGNEQQPSLSDMQKALNQQTQRLSESQKSGRELSEKLGELAAEQAKLRKMMEEMKKESNEKGKQEGAGSAGEIIEEMEKIEEDLVNKRLGSRLIERQKKIVTKLLESEKAKQEQEEDDERKGETATDYQKERLPNAFKEYLEQKEKEIELLQTVPPSFTPYYKNEINKYYKRLKSTEN
ncbi:DUF4175 family protein [Marivirga lumbricoides]